MNHRDGPIEKRKGIQALLLRNSIPFSGLMIFSSAAAILLHIYYLLEKSSGAPPSAAMMGNSFWFVGALVMVMSACIMAMRHLTQNIIASRSAQVEQLRKLRDTLEVEVERRTSSLQQEVMDREKLQARFVAAIGLMKDAYFISNERGSIEFCNSAAERIFGYTVDEMAGMNVNMLLPTEEQALHQGRMRRYRETGEARIIGIGRDWGVRAQRADGSTFPIRLLIDKLATDDGIFYTAIIADLTDKHAWKTKSERMTAVVEHATDCIVVLCPDGTIEYVNPQFERDFGYAADEVLGRRPGEMGWQKSSAEVHAEIEAAKSQGQVWSGHMHSESRGGALLEHDCHFSPILKEDGTVAYYLNIGRNVTEKMAMQRQLNQAQKLESIGQLAAGIAHEINTPTQYVGNNTTFLQEAYADLVTMISGIKELVAAGNDAVPADKLNEMLRDADVDYLMEEIPRAIEQSLEGVSRVTKIVGAMKEFSHPAQEKTMVDLNKAIESTVTVASNEWKYVADMKLDLDSSMPMVTCLPGDMNQVVLNIIVNASHAIADVRDESAAEKGVISVTTRKRDSWAEIRIADTGSGMPEEVKTRIFDPFYTTKEVGKGTGQGLSIAHAVIVEKHAGSIVVDSAPGKGTTFTIRIPIEGASSDAEAGLRRQAT